MLRDAASAKSLLYVSSSQNFDVYVYTYPELKLAGKLTGFIQPQGECTDKKGNVWITSTGSEQIFQFPHGGKSPIATLIDPLGYPVGCAVDSKTGDVAVANIFDFSGDGELLIYKGGRGTPVPYFNPEQSGYYFDGYDAAGDLYVSGTARDGAYALSVLAHGKHTLASVALQGGTINYPGSVQAIGSSLVLGDQECGKTMSSCFYQASISGRNARITRKTTLDGACDVAQGWIQNGKLAGGDYDDCGRNRSGAYLWPFPGGGTPAHGVTGVAKPIGTTISNK